MDRRLFLAGLASIAVPSAVAAAEVVRLRDLYNKDLSFSDLATTMEGELITVSGFMAPPLKAESRFFVLTTRPMAVCPFCESEAEWPNDILAVYTKRLLKVVPFNVPLLARGKLELGAVKDEETGFVSRVRIVDATYERG
ncbi:hypothetical protein [Bauldia litoralis]|uniref:Uncharacterized protein n=1 Tax=Bauldia litoralis TaxID=665467 RepID=A0A1G6EEP3_9HYPH|nr:hypothetical protein [Bauldia litoralis]SDB55852.1 hypothetical protein SAMN02982931_04406 [Bauldia litoralis]